MTVLHDFGFASPNAAAQGPPAPAGPPLTLVERALGRGSAHRPGPVLA